MTDFTKLVSTTILEHGSGVVRCGYAGESCPHAMVPSVLGVKKPMKHTSGPISCQKYPQELLPKFVASGGGADYDYSGMSAQKVGLDALKLRSFFDLHYPVDKTGEVVNFDLLEQMWKLIYKSVLKGSLFLSNLILTFSHVNSESAFERCAEILFEKHNVPMLIINKDLDMAARFCGLHNGILVDMGHNSIKCVPVIQRRCCYKSLQSVPFGGSHMVEFLSNLLSQKGYKLNPLSDSDTLHSLLEDCYVADDFDFQLEALLNADYSTAGVNFTGKETSGVDAIRYDMNVERLQVPELLFQPAMLYGSRSTSKGPHLSLDELVIDTLKTTTLLNQETKRIPIALCGGHSGYDNLTNRLRSALNCRLPEVEESVWDIKCIDENKHASWMASSSLGSNRALSDRYWVQKREYLEQGTSILHKKWL